jgi:site-specific recombinase XerD
MGTFNYKLRTSTNGKSSIYIQYSYGKIKKPNGKYKSRLFRSSTGYTVNNPKNWLKKQRINEVKAEPNASIWNTHLATLQTKFKKKVDEALNNGESLDNSLLKEIQQSIDFTKKETEKREGFNLNNLLEEWINYYETRKRVKTTGRKPTKGTIKSIKNTKETLSEFLKIKPISSPKKINTTLYQDLLNYLEGEGLTKNTIGKIVKNTKSFFVYLKENDNHRIELPNYIPSNWVVLKEGINEIYLTNEELMKMFYLDLSGVKESYSRARDLFLISAFTGLRISDNKRLEKKNIITMEGYRFFTIKSQKTGNDVYIPIVEVVDEILKRNGGIPKSMADQTVNELIKDVAEWSGIDETHAIKRTKGGKEIEETKPKFEWVKSHTARRSFCTNAYLGGMDSISIMAVSGHITEKNFLTYIKVTEKQQAVRNAKHEYIRSLSPSNFKEDGTHKLKAV